MNDSGDKPLNPEGQKPVPQENKSLSAGGSKIKKGTAPLDEVIQRELAKMAEETPDTIAEIIKAWLKQDGD